MASKKKVSAAKKSQKKSKGVRLPRIAQGVGILASIPFRDPLRTQFITGLGSASKLKNVQDGLGYDPASLSAGLTKLLQDTDVGLIVTVGGTVTWNAAAKDPGGSSKPFISLIGGKVGAYFPSPGQGNFVGAISLQSFARNPNRMAKLMQDLNSQDTEEICLISNPNSYMTPAETDATAWLGRIVSANITPATGNPRTVYDNAFANISAFQNPAVTGVVISADPWFKNTAAHLVAAGNAWVAPGGRSICYPLQEYADHNPSAGSRVLHGPKLKQAYKKLGQMAKKYLQNPKPDIIDEEPEDVN